MALPARAPSESVTAVTVRNLRTDFNMNISSSNAVSERSLLSRNPRLLDVNNVAGSEPLTFVTES
jgi:hypothetical protein